MEKLGGDISGNLSKKKQFRFGRYKSILFRIQKKEELFDAENAPIWEWI